MNLSEPLVEAVKQFLRTIVLGMIPVIGAILLFIKSGINVEVGSFNINWAIALAMLVSGFISVVQTSLMSALDKWLHEKDIKTPLDLRSLDVLKK